MKSTELRKVVIISPWHPFPAQQEHGEIEEVEPNEHDEPCPYCPSSVVHPAKHLGEPIVKGGKKAKPHSAKDDVVEMGWDPVGIVEMHVGCQGALDQARKPANREEEDKGETEEERGSSTIDPLCKVATQLKTLIALGTATKKVRREKRISAKSLCPLTNI